MRNPSISGLKKQLLTYMDSKQVRQIELGFQFSKNAHHGQLRKSKKPFISHPLAVAMILANLEQDKATVLAGLLHDTVEDSEVTQVDIVEAFGEEVATLVMGVTKLTQLSFTSKEEAQAENYRKMLLAMAKDIRVVIIKLADRLHNMRTLQYLSRPRQRAIAKETVEIYAPLAHRLGIASIKWELEDLAFYFLDYTKYQQVKKKLTLKRHEREQLVNEMSTLIHGLVAKEGVESRVSGRPKHLYSLYRKITEQNIPFDEIYDRLGIRVLVHSVKECYEVLGVVHSHFKPLSGRFKDYIAMPKSNLYQSLHTTVLGPHGHPIEIQIRTHQMHRISEYGVAAHWEYKEGQVSDQVKGPQFEWIREMIDLQKESESPQTFLKDLKLDLLMDEIFVFTPQGHVKVLVKGSRPLDFAYLIHTEVGHRYIGAKVNDRIVAIDFELSNGDQVEILTSKTSLPKMDWLQVVKTRQAKSKIKQWFKRQNRDQVIKSGESKLSQVLLVAGHSLSSLRDKVDMKRLITQFNGTQFDDILVMIAQGEVSCKEVVRQLLKEIPSEKGTFPYTPVQSKNKVRKSENVVVYGERDIKVTIAKCCNPLPGDDIDGFVVLGKGVSVHRSDCANILKLGTELSDRLVSVEWDSEVVAQLYPVSFQIDCFDRVGILQEVVSQISELGINITQVKTTPKPQSQIQIRFVIQVRHVKEFASLRKKLLQIADIYAISRSS